MKDLKNLPTPSGNEMTGSYDQAYTNSGHHVAMMLKIVVVTLRIMAK
jgi:hypothetical protein